MAALQLISLDTTTPQLRAPASGDTYSAPRALDITPETLTGSSATSSLSIAQTWNTTGTPTALSLNVTDTASNAASLLADFRVGGVSRARITKGGSVLASAPNYTAYAFEIAGASMGLGTNGSNFYLHMSGYTNAIGLTPLGALFIGTQADVLLYRDAANTLAQRNGVNAQAFNIYNTFTDASNYERGFVRWSSNVLTVGSDKAGTGTARAMEFQTDGVKRLTITASNNAGDGIINDLRAYVQRDTTSAVPTNSARLGYISGASTTDGGAYTGIHVFRSRGGGNINGANYAMGTFSTLAYQTTNTWTEAAYVRTISTQTHSNTALGTRMAFGTTPNNSTTVAEVLGLEQSGLVTFGGTTASSPALKRNGTVLETRLADDSAYAPHAAEWLSVTDGVTAPGAAAGRARIYVDSADGDLKVVFADGTVKTIVTDT